MNSVRTLKKIFRRQINSIFPLAFWESGQLWLWTLLGKFHDSPNFKDGLYKVIREKKVSLRLDSVSFSYDDFSCRVTGSRFIEK